MDTYFVRLNIVDAIAFVIVRRFAVADGNRSVAVDLQGAVDDGPLVARERAVVEDSDGRVAKLLL